MIEVAAATVAIVAKKKKKSIGIPNKWVKVDGYVRTREYTTCHLSGPDVKRGALNAIFCRSRLAGTRSDCTVALTTAADAQVGVEKLLYCSLDDSIYTKNNRKT
jgi:hypothetical protein